ncbi:hypothetical protein [Nocardia sp. BMG51109]|uniref:hypothetical protein n=1 Tax=Nocardia sp. BMG51109 TaxID=1056816 RepID=UPI000466C5CE|nr:hypothetical protein [Nocardia sp. BMG51109]
MVELPTSDQVLAAMDRDIPTAHPHERILACAFVLAWLGALYTPRAVMTEQGEFADTVLKRLELDLGLLLRDAVISRAEELTGNSALAMAIDQMAIDFAHWQSTFRCHARRSEMAQAEERLSHARRDYDLIARQDNQAADSRGTGESGITE